MNLPTCPVCGATLADYATVADAHLAWHERTGTLAGWTRADARDRLHDAPAWMVGPTGDADDAPTTRMAPITETVLRRPPPPAVRELRGADLLEALAVELRREERQEDPAGPCDCAGAPHRRDNCPLR